MRRALLLGLSFLLAPIAASVGESPARVTSPGSPAKPSRELKALSSGPVHEAFLSTRGDRQPPTFPDSPPSPVIERPSFEPDDLRAIWIGGYWDWDRTRDDFTWVTGVWRVPPTGRLWVNGYWKRDENGWRRVPGFWSDRRTSRLDFRVEGPPTTRPDEDPGHPPKPNCFYIPGEYVPDGDKIVWKKGYWSDAQPDWSWVPARWIRQPEGWIFQDGFWDRPLEGRGVLFAPAALADNGDETGQLYYSPYTIISPEIYGQLYGAFGRAGSEYDGYAGASYNNDGRYYSYADYGMLANYYGYLDYPNLGAFGYPYYATPLIYESFGYSYPLGLINGLYYGGLGYGIGGLGLGIINPGWGYPIWSGGWGRPSWTGWGWSGPSWGSWPGWPWGYPGWGWNWYWPTWAGNGWSGPSWASFGGFPLGFTDWGWGGFGFGGVGDLFGYGGLAANSAAFGAPFAFLRGDPPRSANALPFQNTGRGRLVSAAATSRPGLATSAGTSSFVNRGTMRQAPVGAGNIAAGRVKPPPSSRPFASLSPRDNIASLGRMRTQALQTDRTSPATGPAPRQTALATGAGSWNHAFNGTMRGPSSPSMVRGDSPANRAVRPTGPFAGQMRSSPGGGDPAALSPRSNPPRGLNPAMRGFQTPQQSGAMDPHAALRGMRTPQFNPQTQTRALTSRNQGVPGIQGRAPGPIPPNLDASRAGNPALARPGAGVYNGGAMRGGNVGGLSGFSPGISGGPTRGGSVGGFNPGLSGGAMRGSAGPSPGLTGGGMRGGGGFGASGPGFSGGAMRGGGLGAGSIGGGGFGGGMRAGPSSPSGAGAGAVGAGGVGGGFGGGMR